MSRFVFTLLALLLMMPAHGQHAEGWQSLFERMGDEDDYETPSWDGIYDALSQMADSKRNINIVTRGELEIMPFLDAIQVEAIMRYVHDHGGLASMQELHLIRELSDEAMEMLPYFFFAGDAGGSRDKFPSLGDIVKHGRHNVMLTVDLPTYTRHGDEDGYLGDRYKHSVRYAFNYGGRVQLGLIASKDAGEPFFSHGQGYDYYSGYLMLRRLGRVEQPVVGRYRMSFGMGLVVSTNQLFGKIATLSTLGNGRDRITGHISRSDFNYLQGAAVAVALGRGFHLTAFGSSRHIDGTLDDDGTLSTLVTTGYHRTESEMARKSNTTESMAGMRLNWQHGGWHAGATAMWTGLNRELQPYDGQLYRLHYPAGKNFGNASVDYGYVSSALQLSGETAVDDDGKLATLNNVSWAPTESLTLAAVQRYYSYRYKTLYGRAFSEGGRVQNESGVLASVNWKIVPHLSLLTYADYAYFPWARYQASATSHAWDYLAQLTYSRKQWLVQLRARWRNIEKDNAAKTALVDDREGRLKLTVTYAPKLWTITTQGFCSLSDYKQRSRGWMVNEVVTCNAVRNVRLYANVGYFHTDDYSSRIYAYEHNLLYNFAFLSYYGHGMRWAFSAQARLGQRVTLEGKIGTTNYFDRSCISSGLAQIDHSSKTDIGVQLRLKL